MFSSCPLRILYMHTLYFDHLHFQPHPLTLPDPPLSPYPLQTLFSFVFHNPFSSVCTTYVLIGLGPPTGAWPTYLGPHPYSKHALPLTETINCS